MKVVSGSSKYVVARRLLPEDEGGTLASPRPALTAVRITELYFLLTLPTLLTLLTLAPLTTRPTTTATSPSSQREPRRRSMPTRLGPALPTDY
eukprot:scaffold43916_cov33-Phaeocystis_antarctica.AAC.1